MLLCRSQLFCAEATIIIFLFKVTNKLKYNEKTLCKVPELRNKQGLCFEFLEAG